ncbi:Protein phosphatase PHLPP-like protein [Sergentomyia squamirostris]
MDVLYRETPGAVFRMVRSRFMDNDDSYSALSTTSVQSSPKSVLMRNSLQSLTIGQTPVTGWIRVFCGPDRTDISCDDPSRMVHVVATTSVEQVVSDMDLPADYTIWLQIGGNPSRRLDSDEKPFVLQENFFKTLGYTDDSRRSRLSIDPDLKHLIRFHIGPAELSMCPGVLRSGFVEILKGLVFPQWRRRSVALFGSKIIVYPGNNCLSPEVFEVGGADIYEHSPGYNRLILKIQPKTTEDIKESKLPDTFIHHPTTSIGSLYHSSASLASVINGDNDRVLFLGFEESWERDLWSNWLLEDFPPKFPQCFMRKWFKSVTMTPEVQKSGGKSLKNRVTFCDLEEIEMDSLDSLHSQVSECISEDEFVRERNGNGVYENVSVMFHLQASSKDVSDVKCLDIGGSGLQTIPEIVLKSTSTVEELLAGQNKLQEIALTTLVEFPNLKILRLPGNGFTSFPAPLLNITALTVLDLSDNEIQSLPDELADLENLEELRLDRNEVSEVPNTLKHLRRLQSLHLAHNKIQKLPPFMTNMRTLGLVDMYNRSEKFANGHHGVEEKSGKNDLNPPLTKVNLRANHLKGSIILGNYGYLTQLDLSENSIEFLDLSALDQLESVQCCRNNLTELTVNGRVLTSLIADKNRLNKLNVSPVPTGLRHLDISFNAFVSLPEWLSGCQKLHTLSASNNCLSSVPEHLFTGELVTLQLGYNRLKSLPTMSRRKIHLRELFLQSNAIVDLPENFFFTCESLTVLNVASNRLISLPIIDGCRCHLERLYATNNQLTDRALDSLACLNQLRVFHAAYNRLTTFPESCVSNLPHLEELILSGNRLQHLPDNLTSLAHLKVLRVHSNQLQSVPPLAKLTTLKVLDLAHNQLDKVNLVQIVPKKLQFLDLSCNSQLQVDPKQLQACKSQRPMSLVDVSGKNRASLPSSPASPHDGMEFDPPWKLGFSETAGSCSKLFISQLRLPGFCSTEGVFGMFDGEESRLAPNFLIKTIPKLLLEERTVKETASDYMKYTLLAAHRELKQQGQKSGVSVTLCHISRAKTPESPGYTPQTGKRYVLRVASVGESTALLIRRNGNVKLTLSTPNRQIGNSANYPNSIPDPETCEVVLGDLDEYLVIGNRKLWNVVDATGVAAIIRSEENVILAAKRLQDIAQSYGAEENLSVIVLKFNNIGSEMDIVMRELRQTIRGKPASIMAGFCKCGCCCESNNSCCHSGELGGGGFIRQSSNRSDRSSPSGQSDQTASELAQTNGQQPIKPKNHETGSITSRRSSQTNYATNERRSLRGGVVRAVRAKIEEEREKEESDSAMSEEQFKCWEYMLEQNTQLLFDKELNTISRAFTKRQPGSSNLTRAQLKALSSSSPQLAAQTELAPKSLYAQYHTPIGSNVPFLSKHFGSARSFHPQSNGLFRAMRFNSGRIHPINGGPNAAYFGSLQRLMPYNLEYDFAVMHERGENDSLEPDSRMQQYWGVATTEL